MPTRLLHSRSAGAVWLAVLFLVSMGLALLGGCAAPKPIPIPTPVPSATLLTAGTDAGTADANIKSAKAATTHAAVHADDIGKAILSPVPKLLDDAASAVASIIGHYSQTIDDQVKRAEVYAAQLEAVKAKAAADAVAAAKQHQADVDAAKKQHDADVDAGNSALMATLRTIIGISIGLTIAGIFLSIYCKSAVPIFGFMMPLGKSLAGAGAAGAAIALIACFAVQLEHDVTPVVVRELEWLIGAVFALFFAALVYELVIHRKTIWETAKDTAASVQPNVPFPPTVANLLNKVAPNSPAAQEVPGQTVVLTAPGVT